MRNMLNLRNYVLALMLLGWTVGQAQFEVTLGRLGGIDEMADVKPLPDGNYIVVANTTSLAVPRIVLAELSSHGYVIWFKTIHEDGVPGMEYAARNVALAFDSTGVHSGYFITGSRGGYPRKMIVIRTDLDGDPMWTAVMNNIPNPNTTLDECGVSLELQANGDVIAVGSSVDDQASNDRFSVTRISQYGIVQWSYRYGSASDFQFDPMESCMGTRNGAGVVTVVGNAFGNDQTHSFMSCVRASNGTEYWRQLYESGSHYDEGLDVVQNPVNKQFMLVGWSAGPGDGPRQMWVCRAVATTGAIEGGALYSLPDADLVANDVCLSLSSTAAVVAGWTGNNDGTDAFALQLPFTSGALPAWSYAYSASDPYRYVGDESIERVPGTNGGYVIGTQGHLEAALTPEIDIHVIRVDDDGRHNFLECPELPLTLSVEVGAASTGLHKQKTKATWGSVVLDAREQEYFNEACDTSTMELIVGEMEIPELAVSIFPNPVFAGEEVRIEVELTDAMEVQMDITDLSNTRHKSLRENRDAGLQSFSFQVPESPVSQVYVIRITLANGQQKLIKILAI